jgi:hypothetical protein
MQKEKVLLIRQLTRQRNISDLADEIISYVPPDFTRLRKNEYQCDKYIYYIDTHPIIYRYSPTTGTQQYQGHIHPRKFYMHLCLTIKNDQLICLAIYETYSSNHYENNTSHMLHIFKLLSKETLKILPIPDAEYAREIKCIQSTLYLIRNTDVIKYTITEKFNLKLET